MPKHLTMNTVAHEAIRRTVDRFDRALAGFPDGSQQRADELKRAWDFFDDQLHHHHSLEEELFWPALQQTDADLTGLDELDAEHDAMRAALGTATTAMGALQAQPTATNSAAAKAAVDEFSTVLLNHLAHEERDLEPVSAAYKDAPSMKAALNQAKKTDFKNLGNTLEWLQDGADADDRAGLREAIPPPVVFLVGKLGGGRYRKEIAPVWA